jgi:hypothetical protein
MRSAMWQRPQRLAALRARPPAVLLPPSPSPRRGFALPALPIVLKVFMKLGGPLSRLAQPMALYCLRWTPYYICKFTVINTIKQYGARRVYKHVCYATKRLISTEDERQRVRGHVKALLRLPGDVQTEIGDKLCAIDGFLLRWALENEEAYMAPRGGAGEWSTVERQMRGGAKHCHAAASVMHTMGPDMHPTVQGMEVVIKSETLRSAVTGRPLQHGPKQTVFVHGPSMTVLGLKCLLAVEAGIDTMPPHAQRLMHKGQVLEDDDATLEERGVLAGDEIILSKLK